jgi:hypothetical protein
MAQAQPTSKVLRIGIVQDGKIVQERLIKAGEPVTVGESTKNTFVFPPSSLPKRYQLFVPKGKGYVLQFTEDMGGKISYKNAIVSLDQLKERGDAVRKGGTFTLPLSESNRGKVSIDGVTVLFQFVPPPPEPLRAVKQDFRPKLIEDDDPVFLGFLALWTAMAAVLMIVVYNTEPQESRGLSEIPDRFTKLVMEPKDSKPPELDEKETDDSLDGPEVVKKESQKDNAQADAEAAEDPGPAPDEPQEVAQARREEQAREEVLQQSSLLMALIGTTGDANSGDRVKDLFAEDDWGGQNLDAALANVSGAEVATTSEVGVRTAQGGGEGSADIGDLAKAGTGGANVGAGPATTVEGVVSGGNADILSESGDDEGIKAVIRRYRGQIKYCYDARLKENPSLEGRVDVQFVITRGRVTSANILGNTTGDAQLGSCIARKVESWRFDAEAEAEVVYPFILAL